MQMYHVTATRTKAWIIAGSLGRLRNLQGLCKSNISETFHLRLELFRTRVLSAMNRFKISNFRSVLCINISKAPLFKLNVARSPSNADLGTINHISSNKWDNKCRLCDLNNTTIALISRGTNSIGRRRLRWAPWTLFSAIFHNIQKEFAKRMRISLSQDNRVFYLELHFVGRLGAFFFRYQVKSVW